MFFVRAYLWIAPHLLLLICLLGIFFRKLQRECLVFVMYLLLQLAYFIASFTGDLLGARHLVSRTTYLWIFIVGLVLSAVVEIGVMYELAFPLIFSRLKRTAHLETILQWTLGVLVLIGVVIAASLAWTSKERLLNIAQTLNVVASVIALGLLFAIILSTTILNIPWRSLQAGIALGFGISAATELAGSGILSQFGSDKSGYIAADLVRMSGFHICAVIWLIYVFLPEKRPSENGCALSVADIESRAYPLQRIVEK